MKILLAVLVLVCLGCASKSNIVSPVTGEKDQSVMSQNSPSNDCLRTQELYVRRLTNLRNELERIRAIEDKTTRDLHVEQILEQLIIELQAEADQAICAACLGAC